MFIFDLNLGILGICIVYLNFLQVGKNLEVGKIVKHVIFFGANFFFMLLYVKLSLKFYFALLHTKLNCKICIAWNFDLFLNIHVLLFILEPF